MFNDKGILLTSLFPVNNWKLTSNFPKAEQTVVVDVCICHFENAFLFKSGMKKSFLTTPTSPREKCTKMKTNENSLLLFFSFPFFPPSFFESLQQKAEPFLQSIVAGTDELKCRS